ncbi:MAG: energy transducer TonB [Thermodesulfovibrionia bacterium]|nr:energy transducer TonB [Thermodesulfovibrionia bacterium]
MMGLQRTFIFSLLLHGTFAALLLLAVRFQGESGKMLNEKVFFIDLKSDVEKPAKAVTKDVSLKKTVVKKMQKEPALIVNKREHDEEIISRDPESDNREVSFTKSLSIDPGDTSGAAKGSDITFSNEKMEYTNSIQGGEEIITSSKTTDDKRGGISESDALKLISSAIEREKTYPKIARRRGIEGTVHVSFRIGASGEPSEIEVLKSSGYNMLDEATMKAIKKAGPYPYIEDRVEVPVTYRLDD